MGFRDGNNEIVGFDVDLAKETLGRLGYEVVFQPID
ncbi:transporter substrate-binding domain-containing protein [Jeotgalibaca arthritidis]|uniref:Transporter substrate-binding domain-containing protein n=1 Tax=Jeotgalibaca arthritidis TaxID=1868794 RepID=A0A6G7KBJ1_9LACT|nr:transporter substrate-binding domain-containing protein [Jeotgalibaca arthritidis]